MGVHWDGGETFQRQSTRATQLRKQVTFCERPGCMIFKSRSPGLTVLFVGYGRDEWRASLLVCPQHILERLPEFTLDTLGNGGHQFSQER